MNPLDRILFGIAGAVLVFVTIVIVWLSIANAHLHAELAEVKSKDTACLLANDEFRQKAEQQNAAITVLQNETALRARRAAEADLAAQKSATIYEASAKRIAETKAKGSDCEATLNLINNYIAGLK